MVLAFAAPAMADDLRRLCRARRQHLQAGYEGVGPADTSDYSAYDAADACAPAHDADPTNVARPKWLGRALPRAGPDRRR